MKKKKNETNYKAHENGLSNIRFFKTEKINTMTK